MPDLHLQLHHGGRWHDAARVSINDPTAGVTSRTGLDYDNDYVLEADADGLRTGHGAHDSRAVSVRFPVSFNYWSCDSWPPFLLDLLPQGIARDRLIERLRRRDPDLTNPDLELLLLAGGAPIGNMRVREAWERECGRLAGGKVSGLSLDEILGREDRFRDIMDNFLMLATGASGVQGDWPKALVTKARDGLWYPDPMVADGDAVDYAIAKMLRATQPEFASILRAEAPYIEIARAFGLRTGRPLVSGNGVVLIPRFDREIVDSTVVRHGQESLVSAIGVAAFGHLANHETYLETIKCVSSDPAAEVREYVFRDILNLAMGNPDNHGRNTALQKRSDGWIGLSPLYDFAPMRLDPQMIVQSTRWACSPGDPDFGKIAEAASAGVMDPVDLRAAIAAKADQLRALPETARKLGLEDRVVELAFRRHADVARMAEAVRRTPMTGVTEVGA